MTDTSTATVGRTEVRPFLHPQGCRGYLIVDPGSKHALALDPHLDLVADMTRAIERDGLKLRYVVDSHTHADHPSGAGTLADRFSAERVAHAAGEHTGVTRHPEDGDRLEIGEQSIEVRHAPGHTLDHVVLLTEDALFSGDTLMIGAVARTDFLGGDAGQLFDSIHRVVDALPDAMRLFPGHDYAGRVDSTIGDERRNNPWLAIEDREQFVTALTANPPPRPANMDDLLRLNREGVAIPESVSAQVAKAAIEAGGVNRVFDVRTDVEHAEQHVPGARHVPLDQLAARVDEIRAMPAPRLILCRSGKRAKAAREQLEAAGVRGLSVIEGGILAYAEAGGETAATRDVMSLERQVRIAAGALVVLGAVLGFAVHPGFHVLSGAIGAGLVFAGVTDTCGMGMMLAKMPWNRHDTDAVGATASAAGGGCAAPAPGGGCAAPAPPTASGGGGCAATPPNVP